MPTLDLLFYKAISYFYNVSSKYKFAHYKLDYIHYNPVEAGFVTKPLEYSSAIDFGGKGLLEIMRLDTLVV